MPVEKLTIPSDKKLDAILYMLVEIRAYQISGNNNQHTRGSGLDEDYEQDEIIKMLNKEYS